MLEASFTYRITNGNAVGLPQLRQPPVAFIGHSAPKAKGWELSVTKCKLQKQSAKSPYITK